jgi:hypothetical protein
MLGAARFRKKLYTNINCQFPIYKGRQGGYLLEAAEYFALALTRILKLTKYAINATVIRSKYFTKGCP